MLNGRPEGVRASQRTLWRLLETYHALVYYAPERTETYARLGLKGGWMGYFATRSAPLGQTSSSVVTACFYGFAERMVNRALPDAWNYTTPAAATGARYEVFDAASTRLLGPRATSASVRRAAERLSVIVHALAPHGRPLFAAHSSVTRPDEPHLALFWAATALREYRGDAHVAALQASEVSPAASNVLMTAMRLTPPEQRTYRGWSDEEWQAASADLTDRGWLRADGQVTQKGQRQRAHIERETDRLVAPALSSVTEGELGEIIDSLGALVGTFVTAGELPYPNGMGVAPVAELAVPR